MGNLAGMEGVRRLVGSAHGRARRPLAGGIVALALTLGLFLCSGIQAPGARATALKAMWGPSVHNGVSVFPTFKDLGVNIYEDDLHWDLIAPRRPRNPRTPNDPAYVWP